MQQLLDGTAILKEARPDVVFRVYLAADLEFLVPDLVAAGCEIKLMANYSIRHNTGAMWRSGGSLPPFGRLSLGGILS